jgi:UDP-3-O-[3-hydroxymyristoyl] N-acetylglucosamine deacetylase/3-hydroxyacyl-[acyl-carrier-protein] dehydratase
VDNQRTIEKEIALSGVGLHTGNKVSIKFRPAEANTGIHFIRSDIPGRPVIKATLDNVIPSKSHRRTSIGNGSVEIYTIEHLMAVLAGLKIDNLYIELDNNEVPGFDGSGQVFSDLLIKAGLKEQQHPRQYYSVKEAVSIEDDGAIIAAFPSSELKISYTLNYDHPQLKTQFLTLSLTEEEFKDKIVSSRTFCVEDEVDELIKAGLGKGANYENTLVVGKNGVIKNRLRFEDEFVRHKILDLIGDLYLLGMSLRGNFIAIRSGHTANLKLLNKIRMQKERYALGGVSAVSQTVEKGELGVEEIMKILPHRPPFLFVDKILSLEKGKRAVGLKTFSW